MIYGLQKIMKIHRYMRRILKLHHESYGIVKKSFFLGGGPRAAKRNSALSKPERDIPARLEKKSG